MKQILAAVAVALMATSCGNEAEDKLMGKWQLRQVVMPGGEVQKVDTVWYNFQNSIFMYQIYDEALESRYRKSYGYNQMQGERELHIKLISDPNPVDEFLRRTDWEENPCLFTIDKLTRKELIMSGNGRQYVFRKY